MVISALCKHSRNLILKSCIHTLSISTYRAINYNCSLILKPHEVTSLLVQNKLRRCSTDVSSIELKEDELNYYYDILEKQYSEASNKKYLDIAPYVEEIQTMNDDLVQLKNMSHDKDAEIADMALKDVINLNKEIISKKLQIISTLNINFKSIEDNIENFTLEISSGAGGQEAMLFAKEMFNLYCSCCTKKEWPYTVLETVVAEAGGFKRCSIDIQNKEAYKFLRYEGGVHRVQRIPTTESKGRIHTSTVSVCIMPEPSKIELNIKESDLKYEAKRGSGPGGQNVNKSSSCCRITHLPTGLQAESQKDRIYVRNSADALRKLKILLFGEILEKERGKFSRERKIQVGTRGRSEKIRTYNFVQDRVTDHRIPMTVHNMLDVLSGGDNFQKLAIELVKCSQKDHIGDIILYQLGRRDQPSKV